MHNITTIETSESRDTPPPVQQALLPWLGLLQQLYPPNGVLLVGAGGGNSPWVQHLMTTGHRNVTLIEADEATAARLKLVTQAQPSWKVLAGLVGRESSHTPFYTASLQPESGLLEPESLRSLWPNLKTTHKQTRQAIALAELQQDTEPPANWLLVDCLPALPIIQGAAQQLAAFDVIALRVLLSNTQDTANNNNDNNGNNNNNNNNNDNNGNAHSELTQSASANALHPALHALGFRCLAIETSRHPAIGHALFVRDTAALALQLQQQLAQQTQTLAQAQAQAKAQAETATAAAAKQAEERAAQVQQITQAKAAADQLATERQAQLDQLQTQLKRATEQAQAATQEAEKAKAAAAAANEATAEATAAAAKQAEEHAAQVQQLTQAKAAADQLATERQAQLDQLQTQLKQATEQAQAATQEAEKAKAAAATAATATAAATAAAAAAAKQTEEHAAKVQQLTQAKAAADHLATERQTQLDQLQTQLKQATEQVQATAQETETANATTAAAAKQAEDRAAEVKQLTQAKAAADKLATERQQQIEQLKEAAAQAKSAADKLVNEQHQQMEKLKDQLIQSVSSSEHASQQLGAIKKQHEQLTPLLAASSGLPNQWNAFAEALSARLAGTETALAYISKQLAPEQLRGLLLPPLNEKLLEQGVIQKDQLKEVETRFRTELGKGLGNAVKQIEAFVSIQNYLTTGESISGFHGWPISPDIGLFLLDRMREQHYDLIIEFGSGTSTALFSRAVKILTQQAEARTTDRSATPSSQTTIISFEHDALYYSKTQQMLKARGLEQHVHLVHAPLIEWCHGAQTYLYYDCQTKLIEMAQQHADSQLRILLLVDGPPGVTCLNARYPAVPLVFSALGRHHIDVVLDDASRPEEQQVIELWRTFWKSRSIRLSESTTPSEKGIYFASNYTSN